MSEPWLYAAVIVHIVQFSVLLVLGRSALPKAALAVLALGVISVTVLLLYSRRLVRKNRSREGATLFRKKLVTGHQRTPDEEMDSIPENAIYCLSVAAILEGALFAFYTILVAGSSAIVDSATGIGSNPHSSQIILETLRFASITLLAFHRILRPANRVDPMRTMLEVRTIRTVIRYKMQY
jgi:tetrahydromethanopterin S-methyltransferase subunit E